MRNKEIKVGDQVWLYAPYMSKMKSGYIVKSVKKSNTLVTVVAETEHPFHKGRFYEITLYGHYNSSILSSYDRVWGRDEYSYTCDYSLIEEESITADRDHKLKAAGEALLNLSNFFKK